MVWWSKIVCGVYLCLILVGAPAWFFAHAGQPTVPFSALGPSFGRIIWIMAGAGGFALWVVLVSLLYRYKAEVHIEIDERSMTFEQVLERRYKDWFPKHGIRAGHVPSRDEIRLLLDDLDEVGMAYPVDLFGYNYPGSAPDYDISAADYVERWVDRAPPETYPLLLNILDAGRPFQVRYEDEFHHDGLAVVLGTWGEKYFDSWPEEISARFSNPLARPAAFASLTYFPLEAVLPVLTPWIERADELTELEILILVSVLDDYESPLVAAAFRLILMTLHNPSDRIVKELEVGIAKNEDPEGYRAAMRAKTSGSPGRPAA